MQIKLKNEALKSEPTEALIDGYLLRCRWNLLVSFGKLFLSFVKLRRWEKNYKPNFELYKPRFELHKPNLELHKPKFGL